MTFYLILNPDSPATNYTIGGVSEAELLRRLKTYDLNGPHEVFIIRPPRIIRHHGTYYPDTEGLVG